MATLKRPPKGKRASQGDLSGSEAGAIQKKWTGKIPVCVVFPNTYYMGMSNLAVHMLYKKLNQMDNVVCERCFYDGATKPLSLESARPLSSFDIIFFTLSFELDYINIPKMLATSSIRLNARERTDKEPILVGGGICVMSNPEPLHNLFDLFIMGDIETTVEPFMETYADLRGADRQAILDELSAFEWAYNPTRLDVTYNEDGTVRSFVPEAFHVKMSHYRGKTLGASAIVTDKTEFSRMFLVEGTRGCPSRCPFCLIGNVYDFIYDNTICTTPDVPNMGILGGGVSFYPGIEEIVKKAREGGIKIHLPSMRIDKVPLELIRLMQDEIKTLTFGIEAATERLRRFIGKPLTDEAIYERVNTILDIKPFHLKLYFMVGLYGETGEDIERIAELTKKIKHIMVKGGAKKGFVGAITVHVSPFVPKPATPFQWLPMDHMESLKKKIGWLKKAFGAIDNTYFTHESVKFSFLQAVLSRGDRKVGDVISRLAAGETFSRVLTDSPVNLNFYALRQRSEKEVFPWDFITTDASKKQLWQRLVAALA
ncbi:MAG TPA: radical SAM protein [Syntrophorhabdaceae bacterium]|nr:radical SAM protein [Syntrophorhabdaceae bacterium]